MTIIATQIFISHSSGNADIAKKICSFLEKRGKRCWIAPRDIPAGAEYGAEIIDGIESSDAFVLVFTEAANRSQHVLREVERAVNKKIPIIVYKTEECAPSKSLEYFLLSNQWLDAVSDGEGMLTALNTSIEKLAATVTGDSGAPIKTVHVSNKAVPLMLGVIAVVIIAAAAIIAVSLSGAKTPQTAPETGTSQAATTSADLSQTDDISDTSELSQSVQPEASAPDFSVGDYISFGRYYPAGYTAENNDGEILWQVIGAENGTVKLISVEIVDIKPYDCAESGTYDKDNDGNDYDRKNADAYTDKQLCEFRGNGDWSTSDLRAWLNSDGAVTYSSEYQGDRATDEHGNGFGNQLGFLSSFTKDELLLLCEADGERVTLLSVDEVSKCAENADFILHPSVTKSAAASDATSWYGAYAANGADDYFWATKTQSETEVNRVYCVNSAISDELFITQNAAISGFGIRSVITIKPDGAATISGDGSRADPYRTGF